MTSPAQSASAAAPALVTSLSTQYGGSLLGVPRHGLRLRWHYTAANESPVVAHEIEWADTTTDDALRSGALPGDGGMSTLAPGGPLPDGGERRFRVRLATEQGWGPWSDELVVDATTDRLAASVISAPSAVAGASPYFRRTFTLRAQPTRARLRASSLGINELFLNGERVGDEHLAPGWTSYLHRIVVATHDVTRLLSAGPNALGAVIADGWYRGRLGWRGRTAIYGSELGVVAQLDVEYADGTAERIVTDGAWRASTGSVASSSIYDGTCIDLACEPVGWSMPGFDDGGWEPVSALDVDPALFVPRIAPPVRVIAELPMTARTAGDRTVLDAAQNVAGWVRLVVRARRGDVITVRHAEVLEGDGSLHLSALRSARATDTYVIDRDGEHVLEPRFTYHGFRFADVHGAAEVVSAHAIAVSSDTPARATFACSHPALTALHDAVSWSQRGNFVSLPTDCPQRDERLGWTGDVQAFGATAVTLYDVETFLMSWLEDLADEQHSDGSVPAVVPDILVEEDFLVDGVPTSVAGRAGWADAATIVPWAIYESYGSDEVLRRQLDSMRSWVRHLEDRAGGSILLPSEFQFGDWLDPDAPGDRPWEAKVPADFVANAFFSRSARILARAERVVGEPSRAEHAEALAQAVASATWQRWGDEARVTATGLSLAIEFGIAPDTQHAQLGTELAELVRDTEGRITTGFLGTPLVLPALTRTGHLNEAYLMLLRREMPSWLYVIDRGATTMWERWDAIAPDGSINAGDLDTGDTMISFNHYAYGAVIDWVYRTVAGIAPVAEAPGYQRIRFAPRPGEGIDWARASVATRRGTVGIDWQMSGSTFRATVVIPPGSVGELSAPVTAASRITIDGAPGTGGAILPPGTHTIEVTDALIADPTPREAMNAD